MEFRFTLPQLHTAAQQVWNHGKSHAVWALHGQMGAGKTTFVHALCEYLGVKDVISSPTFAIINEYYSNTAGTIYHMDWYRIKDEEEAIAAGVEDCLLSGCLCLVEWPEKAEGILPDKTLHLYFTTIDEQTRVISTTPSAML